MTVELHTLDTGGEGVPLVVIHGLLGSADNWRSHIKQWQQQRRVVAIDLRNHGRSPHAEGMRYGEMADDVLEVLDRLDIERCHLLGHSMGGKVAMTLARLYPQRVASLAVADIAPVRYDHGHDAIFAALRHVEAKAPDNRREVDALLAEYVEEKPIRLFLATNLVRGDDGIMRWRVGLDQIEADYENIRDEPDGDRPYEGPSLVLRGANSHYVTDEMLPRVHEVMPRAEVVSLDAGHWLHAERPEAFQEAVNVFIDRVEGLR
ncbi:acyl-CoA esterase [Litchfieldella qijiaojingensis]|uniref:Acyl-CoA esterase n=1 Tax=Litchfieldella qijiaojingensis TaxID=980347 RepID=A0ABQ2YCA0_9GAMM|nr:alpha/beta fold hydrolase [Halomonas qijiaojingensis]GGX78573.1 acyl-CoA esterase [Halomonas qijiaojingensis]